MYGFYPDGIIGTPEHEPSGSRPRQDSEMPPEGAEEGETMDATNDDDAAMMAMMGLTGFGTTKVSTRLHCSLFGQRRISVTGETCGGKSRRRCGCQEATDMAAVYESVCVSFAVQDDDFADQASAFPYM